jgi:hypothetical protein
MRQEAMRYGEQAQQVFDLMRQNPNVQAQMRAPLYEEKVVDLILGRAKVADKSVTKEELLREDDLPEGIVEPAKKAAKPKAAKAEAPAKPVKAAKPAVAKAQPKPAKAKAKPG